MIPQQAPAPSHITRFAGWLKMAGLALVLAAFAVGANCRWRENDADPADTAAPSPDPDDSAERTRETADPPPKQSKPQKDRTATFEKLKGKWLRTDGNYVIEIKKIDTDGNMDARYFNPGPIHVSRAEAAQEGRITQVFMELRDVNYPGCIYRLGYNSRDDRLEGTYFQAAVGQQYPVVFVRLRE